MRGRFFSFSSVAYQSVTLSLCVAAMSMSAYVLYDMRRMGGVDAGRFADARSDTSAIREELRAERKHFDDILYEITKTRRTVEKMGTKVDDLNERMGTRVDDLNAKFDGAKDRSDRMGTRVDDLNTKIDDAARPQGSP